MSRTYKTVALNRYLNKDHNKLAVNLLDVPKVVISVVGPNLDMLPERDIDEKFAITLLIVGVGLIAYSFW